MMMPANFSAIAENELTYVVGGSAVTDWAKQFNTNVVTMIGNTYVKDLVNITLGTMFSGSWGADGTVSIGDAISNTFFGKRFGKDMTGFNKVMQVVGLGAAVYQLGTSATGSFVEDPGDGKVDVTEGGWKYTIKYNNFLGTNGVFAAIKSVTRKMA